MIATILAALLLAGSSSAEVGCDELAGAGDQPIDVVTAERVGATASLPEHCLVVARVAAGAEVQVRLPVGWNGKFLMVGNGGYLGMFFDQSYGLARGYATASTDTGHKGGDPRFAHDDPAAETDFAYRAMSEATLAAKTIVATYYGRPPARAYFRGCSNGGRQGLVQAQRFPGHYDGYSIGAPLYDYAQKQLYNATWVALAQFGNDRAGYVPHTKLELLHDIVFRPCDALDGLEDGLISDPRRCDPSRIDALEVCGPDDATEGCFTPSQLETLRKIYAGPGKGRYPGHVIGGEWMAAPEGEMTGGWDTYITGVLRRTGDERNRVGQMDRDPYGGDEFLPVQLRNALSFFRFFAFAEDRPEFDALVDVDFDSPPDVSHAERLMSARASDLSALDESGARVLLWHGWADVGLNPLRTIELYEALGEVMGGERLEDAVALFMVPGMYHCEGGPGPDLFDDLTALERWVERGVRPNAITAYKTRGSNDFYPHRSPQSETHAEAVVRSRPLCAYPKEARYRGTGSIDEAASFECATEP